MVLGNSPTPAQLSLFAPTQPARAASSPDPPHVLTHSTGGANSRQGAGRHLSSRRTHSSQPLKLTADTKFTLNHQLRIIACARIARHMKLEKKFTTKWSLTDIYQFGVFTGGGLKAWLQSMPKYNLTFRGDIWGFDSFEGMPHEDPTKMTVKHSQDPMWQAGGLNAASSERAV